MQDYALLYQKDAKRLTAKEKLERIKKILMTDLPPVIMIMCIMILVRRFR